MYPTLTYALKKDYIKSFQGKYRKFVEQNSFPDKKGNKILIKYYVCIEKIMEKSISKILPDKYYIWTIDHVKNYISSENAFIWVLRVYKLNEPHWAEPTRGAVRFANLKSEVSLEGMKPLLSDAEFSEVLSTIEKLE